MDLAVSNGGSGALVRLNIKPYLRAGAGFRRAAIQVRSGSSPKLTTLPTMRKQILMPLDGIGARTIRVAVQDMNGLWSEWSGAFPFTSSGAFSGGPAQAAFASGAQSVTLQEEPGIAFPDLSLGSGVMQSYRTRTGGGFTDEQRRSTWGPRASFVCVLSDLDQDQTLLLQKFFDQLNGGLKPFHFEFKSPVTGHRSRHIVRFSDPTLASEQFDGYLSSFSFTLTEVVDGQEGADL